MDEQQLQHQHQGRLTVQEVPRPLPIENEVERRAICLRLAIETKNVALSLKNDASVAESADLVVAAARIYEDYITG